MVARLTIDECKKLARSKGGLCLSDSYSNSKTKMKWRCKDGGHIFTACYGDIKYKKTWCNICRNIKSANRILEYNRKTKSRIISTLSEIAKVNDGILISKATDYKTAQTKLRWQCKIGHIFMSTYQQVGIMRQWCPMCYNKTETKLFNIICSLFTGFNIEHNYRGLAWLKSQKNRTLEIDIWVPEIKLAVEYDGQQHFKPVTFGGCSMEKALLAFKDQRKRDILKNKMINKHKQDVKFFIRFNYKENITTEYVYDKLTKVGVRI